MPPGPITHNMNTQIISFLIVSILYSTIGSADGQVETTKLKDSDFLQYQLQCTVDVPIKTVVPEVWSAVLEPSFSAPNETKNILDTKEYEVVIHTYIAMPIGFDDRDIVICEKWDHQEDYEGDRISWKVCERYDTPLSQSFIRIKLSNGSLLFHSNKNGGTTITITSHTDPGVSLPAFVTNMFAGDRLIDDCLRLRKRIGSAKE